MSEDLQEIIKRRLGGIDQHVKTNLKSIQDQVDAIETKNSRKTGSRRKDTFDEVLGRQLTLKSNDIRAFATGQKESVGFEVKATLSDGLRRSSVINEVGFDPDRTIHIRQFLRNAQVSGNSIPFPQETSYTDSTAGQAEGGLKGESDFEITEVLAPVKTRAAFIQVPVQMLDDTAFLREYISSRLSSKLMVDEDNQLLYGDGTGNNIEGITPQAAAYVDSLADPNVNEFDVLTAAVKQLSNSEYTADTVLINNGEYWDLTIKKSSSDEHYLFEPSVRSGQTPITVGGVNVFPTTAINAGDFLAGNFASGAILGIRDAVNIRFFEQDSDNVQRNMITVRGEERFGLPVLRPNAFVYGDFASALAEGSA